MSKNLIMLLAMFIFIALSCGPAVTKPTDHPPGQTGETPLKIAGDDDPGDVPQIASSKEKPYAGPPHIFQPREHKPRVRPAVNPPPSLNSLPKLKLNMAACFGPEPKPRPVPIASHKSSRMSNGANRAYGRGGRAKPKKSASIPSSRAAKGASMGGASMGASALERKEVAPAPSSAPAMEIAADDIGASDSAEEARDSAPSRDDRDESPAGYEDWGASIYLSNDDTMSLSSAQRVIYAIDKFLPLPVEHIRPHELLNYFSFATAQVEADHDFSVYGELAPDEREEGIQTLALAVKGRPVTKSTRRNAALTMVIDRSGSMSDEGRMDFLKKGLRRMLTELKAGDMIHLVLFDHEVCVPAQNFVVGRDNVKNLEKIIDALKPRGSTDLHLGLSRGYDIADKTYRREYSNRVVMITDALTNTGVTDQRMISMISKYYDNQKIRLSGVGVGRSFNDALLDQLTERGKGAYVFLGSEAEVDAVFGTRFISLVETTALDVHFRLHLPPSLRMNVFYGEESSTVKADVQEIHYFANTSQLFLSDLMARGGKLRPEDSVMLTIEYKDPETNEELMEEYAFNLGQMSSQTKNVKKARVIMAWIDMLAQMASRPTPSRYSYNAEGWLDAEGWTRCNEGRQELSRLAAPVKNDREVRRVMELWEKYCSRYERPRNPVKRQVVGMEESWPGAEPADER